MGFDRTLGVPALYFELQHPASVATSPLHPWQPPLAEPNPARTPPRGPLKSRGVGVSEPNPHGN